MFNPFPRPTNKGHHRINSEESVRAICDRDPLDDFVPQEMEDDSPECLVDFRGYQLTPEAVRRMKHIVAHHRLAEVR